MTREDGSQYPTYEELVEFSRTMARTPKRELHCGHEVLRQLKGQYSEQLGEFFGELGIPVTAAVLLRIEIFLEPHFPGRYWELHEDGVPVHQGVLSAG